MKTNILYYAIDGLIGRYGSLKDNIVLDYYTNIRVKPKAKHDILSDVYCLIKGLQMLIQEDPSRKFVIVENDKKYLFGLVKTYNYTCYEITESEFNLLKLINNA